MSLLDDIFDLPATVSGVVADTVRLRPARYAEGDEIGSAPDPGRVHPTKTPEFKAWFGDHEANPANASKVVDNHGSPVVVHHGSPVRDFPAFDESKLPRNDPDAPFNGFWFTTDRSEAEGFASHPPGRPDTPEGQGQTRSFYLNIRNPASWPHVESARREASRRIGKALDDGTFHRGMGEGDLTRKILLERGHDGFIWNPYHEPSRAEFEEKGEAGVPGSKRRLVRNPEDGSIDLYSGDSFITGGWDDFDEAADYIKHGKYVAFHPRAIKSADGSGFSPDDDRVHYAEADTVRYAGPWNEQQHPRGQPQNRGEFAPKSGPMAGNDPGRGMLAQPPAGGPAISGRGPAIRPAQPAQQDDDGLEANWTMHHRAIMSKVMAGLQAGAWSSAPPAMRPMFEERRQRYDRAMRSVLSRMPRGMARAVAEGVKEFKFVPELDHIRQILESKGVRFEGPGQVGGFVDYNRDMSTTVTLDGGFARGEGPTPGIQNRNLLTEDIYGHEISHVLDWRDQWSGMPDWEDAWEAEIQDGKLSTYAATDPSEGFAEFGRLVLSGMTPAEVAAHFPRCAAIWRKAGWLDYDITD